MASAVPTYEVSEDQLRGVIKSSQVHHGNRGILMLTRDREHGIRMLIKVVTACERPLYHLTLAERRRYNPKQLTWDIIGGDSPSPAALLRHAAELTEGGVALIENCVPFMSDQGGDVQVQMIFAQILSENRAAGLVLVFLEGPTSEHLLPSMFADQFVRLNVPYPRAQELEIIAREVIASNAHHAGIKPDPEHIKREAERLSTGVVGLTCSAARDALRDALVRDPQDLTLAFHRLQTHKANRLRRELAMDVLDNSDGEEPIGLDYLVEYIKVRAEKMRQFGQGRAKGVFLIGPPGTGKSLLSQAIGSIVGLPVVKFEIGKLIDSLLGETERKFAKAFATLEAMSPNIVSIDEIEKAFGQSSENDGGTMMRCTGILLSWLSDNPYPNYIVATSNSLSRMGEIGLTMTRSERFDAAFFCDVPNLESRQKMLERWIGDADMACEIAGMSEKFSGADLRSLVKQAQARAEHEGEKLSVDMLKAEVERKRLRAIAIYDQFQELRRWGRMYCEPAGPTDN